ncbi:AAA family ATPase [Streptomyces sp. NPDC013489]|uniref:AAA family ATPase n=1 Tax=Streptomyces sp. NPDC013489 TaxID=3155606 RepID=UPI0033CE3C2B
MTTSSSPTKLVILRGNSASGKSSVAAELRHRYGRGIALVGQDNLRRNVLRERDVPGGVNVGLLDLTTRYALDHGFHAVLEGILSAAHYGEMLTGLLADYRGRAHAYYLDVPYEETLRRHATKPDAEYLKHVTADHLRDWYREKDLLPGGEETVIPASSTLDETAQKVMRESGLAALAEAPAR